MLRTRSCLSLALPAINAIAWIIFFAARPPASSYLAQMESDRVESRRLPGISFSLNSGAPHTILAERPLYQWNTWHGGERSAVKVMELLNLAPLVACEVATSPLAMPESPVSVYVTTWIRAVVFLLLATVQWSVVGTLASRSWRLRSRPKP